MPKIFISYRRNDSASNAGRIYDRLEGRFGQGQVFMDAAPDGTGNFQAGDPQSLEPTLLGSKLRPLCWQ